MSVSNDEQMRNLGLTVKAALAAVCLVVLTTASVVAQRTTDKLDRGLVAVKTSSGVFTSWRILGEEYYDTKYNLYRDGQKVNDAPLSVSNYVDANGKVTGIAAGECKITVKVAGIELTCPVEVK